MVLDVKVGSGAFMRERERARALAEYLVDVGAAFERRVSVLFTRMNEPLGSAVGNALEVIESIELLRDRGPRSLREVTLALATEMLLLGGVETDRQVARSRAAGCIADGSALNRFRALVETHGGRLDWERDDCGLQVAPVRAQVCAPRPAHLEAVDGYEVGMAVVDLGGGRQRKDDEVDASVGLRWRAHVGAVLDAGETVAEIHARDALQADAASARIAAALSWSDTPVQAPAWILGRYPEAG